MQVYGKNVKRLREESAKANQSENNIRAFAWICLSMENVYGIHPGIGITMGYRWKDNPD